MCVWSCSAEGFWHNNLTSSLNRWPCQTMYIPRATVIKTKKNMIMTVKDHPCQKSLLKWKNSRRNCSYIRQKSRCSMHLYTGVELWPIIIYHLKIQAYVTLDVNLPCDCCHCSITWIYRYCRRCSLNCQDLILHFYSAVPPLINSRWFQTSWLSCNQINLPTT